MLAFAGCSLVYFFLFYLLFWYVNLFTILLFGEEPGLPRLIGCLRMIYPGTHLDGIHFEEHMTDNKAINDR